MKINFYLNIPSPHLAGMITALAERVDKVNVITQLTIPSERVSMGWELPNYGLAALSSPSEMVDEVDKGDVEIFSGVFVYRSLFFSFIKSILNSKTKTFVMMEKPNFRGKLGFLKKIKFYTLMNITNSFISGYICFGSERDVRNAINSPEIISLPYLSNFKVRNSANQNKKTICYVGQLVKRKNVSLLIEALSELLFDKALIIGEGPEECKLKKELSRYETTIDVTLTGFVNNDKLEVSIDNYDILVLPSLVEGWGVVVNEALLLGKKVVLSRNAGCSSYFSQLRQVFLFDPTSKSSLLRAFSDCFQYKVTNMDIKSATKLLDSETLADNLLVFINESK